MVDFSVSYVRRLSGLENKLICCFKLMTDMVRGDILELIYYADQQAFLKES